MYSLVAMKESMNRPDSAKCGSKGVALEHRLFRVRVCYFYFTPCSRPWTLPRRWTKIATALLDAVTTAALDAALLGKADASALASLLSTVDGLDTPLEVDTKIANALLGLATEAFVAAQLASRDASITALQNAKADATLLASYATNAALSASETTLQSALDAILAELAALQLSGSGGVVNAPAWAASRLGSLFAEVTSFATCLCCAGQRRRHAEHHGRLLLHGGH